MTTDPKYYSPSIEEFHVGFWYEHRGSEHEEWAGMIVTTAEDLDALALEIKSGDIRVKLLDREDIEAEGFKQISENDKFEIFESEHGNGEVEIIRCKIPGVYRINLYGQEEYADNEKETVFLGTICNRSEFKRILKQVGIKK